MAIKDRNFSPDIWTDSDRGRGPSKSMWKDCPWIKLQNNIELGIAYENDFNRTGLLVQANNGTTYTSEIAMATGATAGSTIGTDATFRQGSLKLETTTDNEGATIAALHGGNVAGSCRFTATKSLWMEARVKFNNITNSKFNAFLGFAEEALCADGSLITTSDAMADKDYVGFQRVFADGDTLDTVFNTASGGTSPVTTGADAITIEADTYIKIGMRLIGSQVYFYANGKQLPDSMLLTQTDFPDGEEMAWYFGIMAGHGDAVIATIDWVRIAQLY